MVEMCRRDYEGIETVRERKRGERKRNGFLGGWAVFLRIQILGPRFL